MRSPKPHVISQQKCNQEALAPICEHSSSLAATVLAILTPGGAFLRMKVIPIFPRIAARGLGRYGLNFELVSMIALWVPLRKCTCCRCALASGVRAFEPIWKSDH